MMEYIDTGSKRHFHIEINRILEGTNIPQWMTKGKTFPNNYRAITCLPMMWKILTAQIREEIYNSLISHGLFPEEEKGCRKWTKKTGEILLIAQHILKESKIRPKNVD